MEGKFEILSYRIRGRVKRENLASAIMGKNIGENLRKL